MHVAVMHFLHVFFNLDDVVFGELDWHHVVARLDHLVNFVELSLGLRVVVEDQAISTRLRG